jgi:hypothetical protein
MFVLDPEELSHWRSQSVTSDEDRKGLRYAPMAFTEQGVAMLSSVLNSPCAVQVNIAIMRTFVRPRESFKGRAVPEIVAKLSQAIQTALKSEGIEAHVESAA